MPQGWEPLPGCSPASVCSQADSWKFRFPGCITRILTQWLFAIHWKALSWWTESPRPDEQMAKRKGNFEKSVWAKQASHVKGQERSLPASLALHPALYTHTWGCSEQLGWAPRTPQALDGDTNTDWINNENTTWTVTLFAQSPKVSKQKIKWGFRQCKSSHLHKHSFHRGMPQAGHGTRNWQDKVMAFSCNPNLITDAALRSTLRKELKGD